MADLASTIGLSTSATHERVRRMTERGDLAIRAVVDPAAAGLGLLVFTLVELDGPTRDEDFKAAAARIPQVLECHHVTGEWNYLLKIRTRDTRELEALMAGALKNVPGFRRSMTMVALSTAKETLALPLGEGTDA